MSDRTFVGLLAGKVPYLRIAIDLASTNSTRELTETPIIGIWRIDRDQFRTIAAHIIASVGSGQKSAEEVAAICDEEGVGNRFFRLNAAVAKWLDENEPEQQIEFDAMIF
jgi:hypothetical protein